MSDSTQKLMLSPEAMNYQIKNPLSDVGGYILFPQVLVIGIREEPPTFKYRLLPLLLVSQPKLMLRHCTYWLEKKEKPSSC